jgi:hypothetical protein
MGFAIRSFVLSLAIALPFWIIGLVVTLSRGTGGAGWTQLAGILGFIAFFGALFIPFREAISSWWALVDGRADAADSAYAAIYGSVHQRQYPMVCTPRRIRNEFRSSSARNYLVVNDGPYVAYVSVFAYGSGLYMGWTMWRRQLPISMFFAFVKQQIDTVTGRGTLFHLILRAEVVQAFREALHAAVTEGLDVALADLRIPLAATFGHDIPVESFDTGVPSAAVAAPTFTPPLPPTSPPSATPDQAWRP